MVKEKHLRYYYTIKVRRWLKMDKFVILDCFDHVFVKNGG